MTARPHHLSAQSIQAGNYDTMRGLVAPALTYATFLGQMVVVVVVVTVMMLLVVVTVVMIVMDGGR